MSQIKNFLWKKLGIRAAAGSKDKDNSLSVSNKSNGSVGSNGSGSRRKNGSSSGGAVESFTNESDDGNSGGMSLADNVTYSFSTSLQLSRELTLPTDQSPMTISNNVPIPVPRRKSPNIQFSEHTKFQSEKSIILSSSEKSVMSDILSDDSSVFSLGTDLTMHDKICSDTNSAVKNTGKLSYKDTGSLRSSTSHSSLTSVLSVSTVATSEAIPTRHIDLTTHPDKPNGTVSDVLEEDTKADIDDLSPADGGVVSVLFAGKITHSFLLPIE